MDQSIFLPLILTLGSCCKAVSEDCTLGRDDLVQTTAYPINGLYIDISNPASCSGVIRRWDVCYYNPRQFHFFSTLRGRLQVWRFDTSLQIGVLVVDYSITIPTPDTPEDFQCVTLEVSREEVLNVTAGDFLGVTLSRSNLLPAVNNYNQTKPAPTLVYRENSDSRINRTASGVMELSSNALHVTVDIGPPLPDIVTTFQDGTPTADPSQSDSTLQSDTTLQPQPTAPEGDLNVLGLGLGVAVAIIAIMLVLVVILATGLVIATTKRRNHNKNKPNTQDTPGDNGMAMTQNQVHGGTEAEDRVEMTQNQVYGVGAEDKTEMTQNQGYGALQSESSPQQNLAQAYELVANESGTEPHLYDYIQ